jgi:hypothetical protein
MHHEKRLSLLAITLLYAGSAPSPDDCSSLAHDGRVVLDNVSGKLYLCTQSGWLGK